MIDVISYSEQFRLKPYKHQFVGIDRLVNVPAFFLQDEMGAGKTKQVIDAAQILADKGEINHVLIVAPAAVRAVWFDPELGELSKHLWAHFPCKITEYHAKTRSWEWFVEEDGKRVLPRLYFTITNYDFIRREDRLNIILGVCNQKTMLVLDESSAIKSYKALQTKVCEKIRAKCGRVILLNGTPIANSPGDLYSQAHILDPGILGCRTWFHFRAKYAIMGGWQGRQIISWRDIDDLQRRLAPYVLRRLKQQCLDLPPKLDSVPITVPLDPTTWKIYKEMRDDMVAWLSQSEVVTASQAIVKAIRLAQITSGFVGGVEEQSKDIEYEERPAFIPRTNGDLSFSDSDVPARGSSSNNSSDRDLLVDYDGVRPVGREKLDAFLIWLADQLDNDPTAKILVWCRFRAELSRMLTEINTKFPFIATGTIWGGQKRAEREVALRLLDPRTSPQDRPVVVIGTPATGSMGLNLTAAHTVIYISNDFSLKTRLQSEDRVHRPGQTYPVSYFDMIATGPQGQKTIDHNVVKALQTKEDMANFTTSAWLDALSEE